MVKFVDQQLTQLRNEVYRMWTMVYNQMDQARQAVLGLDRNIAQQIWVRERLVDAQDIKIDTQVEDFIALYTPVAVDLRFVLAMLKINNDLERIGDYAYSIARFVKETTVQSLDAGLIEKLQLERMFAVVLEMMNELQKLPTVSLWIMPRGIWTSCLWPWDSAASSASLSAPVTI